MYAFLKRMIGPQVNKEFSEVRNKKIQTWMNENKTNINKQK